MPFALVTGGAGFIGSHTVDHLLARGYDVRVIDSLQPRVHPHGKPSYVPSDVDFRQGDVSNRDDMRAALAGIDCVFHLAAYQDYLTDFSTFVRTNVESTALLFELIVERRLPIEKMVFASSQSVAGEGRYQCEEHGTVLPGPRPVHQLECGDWEVKCPTCARPMEPLLIPEPVAMPHTTYAISKLAIELLADRLGRRYGIPTVCMRYTYVQGARNSFYNAYSGICRIFAQRILNGLPPICYEDGLQQRDYVNVVDVARANVLAMESSAADFKVFNVGGGRAVRVIEFADLMLESLGSSLSPLVPGEFRLGDTRHTVSDISSLCALGWQPTVPVEQNIREYVEWMKPQLDKTLSPAEAERVMREQGVLRYATVAPGSQR
ncbi:MAG TPA: NAD-dependent epimerase/dehydratase family protein [Vicinamibacterales bacterium]|jgi:dTDP-L-rhamnose 4-epimerase|nr:NAD-dependent epimerase/dehydratase family protein [Vicinamibacterales bacterium]